MKVIVPIEISKEEVEVITDAMESCYSVELSAFLEKVLQATQETTHQMIQTASAVANSNPYSLYGCKA